LRSGEQRIAFAVPSGPGQRKYRAVVYGEHGPIGLAETTFTIQPGTVDPAPTALLQASGTSGSATSVALASNASGAEFTVRFDRGSWSTWSASAQVQLPPLLPGLHRLEVRARHSGNGARAESASPAALGFIVDSSGQVTVVP
jgi:hypothetical protein